MKFCAVPREVREINKRGGQNKLRGVSKNHEKNKRPSPRLFWTWDSESAQERQRADYD